jgi:hypothetical protein
MESMVDDRQTVELSDDKSADTKPSVEAQAAKIIATIKSDKAYHEKAFLQMRKDMFMAMKGRDEEWSEKNYKANFAGRHVKQKTAALYAKNPKATAKKAERLDFAVWDENPQSLQIALQITQMGVAAQQAAAVSPPEMTALGTMVPAMPQLPPGFQQAQELLADVQQGLARRKMLDKVGKTLEILFARALRDQEPLDFKTAAKQLVRRTCTTGVGYIELGFVREYGPRTGMSEQLADARARLDHLQRLSKEALEGDIDEGDAEAAELEMGIRGLMEESEIVLREGLVFDFPQSTKVIPDQLCKSLVGFVGARHISIEYLFTVEEIQEMFPDADIKSGYRGYGANGKLLDGPSQMEIAFDSDSSENMPSSMDARGKGLVCVWKHYDKLSGLVYYVADGHSKFLRDPAPPDVFVEKFWPVFALTFNAVESETDLFPPSDVYLLSDQQREHNRSRQGMREHREAARPRWAASRGSFDEDDTTALKTAVPFDVLLLNKDSQTSISELLEVVPVPGVDPNLYATEQYFGDTQIVVGTQEAQFGGVSKATATESAIAANSSLASDGSSTDDLDSFLSLVARASSQILLGEMSAEQVKKIVGPGAEWPELSLEEIANEIYLEVEAGSSGRPNQGVEIDNFQKMAPLIMQIPGVDPTELAKEGLRRMDDRLDLAKLITPGIMSIIAQNQLASAAPAPPTDPASAPGAQGPEGTANAPQPPGEVSPGTGAAFGSNQV